jgi:curved DNA-binding protein
MTQIVDLYTALLGGQIELKTLTGKVKLTLKPETQNDVKVKLKGKGMPVYKKKNVSGNLYVTYKVEMPTKLSDEEKTLFTELSQLRN